MPKGTASTSTAIAVLNTGLDKGTLAKLQAGVVVEINLVDTLDTEVAARRIIIGLALHRIKASLKHGEWLPWFKKHVVGIGYRNCAYAMKLARTFVETAGVRQTELEALPADTASLAIIDQKSEAKKFLKSLKAFVGAKSFAELLDEYELRDQPKLGGARTVTKSPAAAPDAEQLYLFSRDELGGWLEAGKTKLIKENLLQHLVGHPEEVVGVVAGLRELADQVEQAAKPLLANSKPRST